MKYTRRWAGVATFYILGASGFAKEVAAYLASIYGLSTTLDRDYSIKYVAPDFFTTEEYWESVEFAESNEPIFSIMGSGQSKTRLKMLDEIRGDLFTVVAAGAYVDHAATVNDGSVIAPNSVIAPYADIRKHVLVNYGATIGHDTIVHECSVVSPNASVGGNCVLERGVYVGAGATIREKIRIGEGATVGMGAAVVKDVPAGETVVGVPAKPLASLKTNDQ